MLTLDDSVAQNHSPEGTYQPAEVPATKSAWFDNPQNWIDIVLLIAAVASVALPMHPELWFVRTTPTGGDFGAHVWGPAYLRDHLLPKGRITGWAPDWYAGFPMYNFYMVLPGLAVVLLDVALPYGIALKLVSVIGPVTMPISAYLFARLAGLSRPLAPLFAAAAAWFVLDEHFTIYGGNLASTMAGEFSFSISLSAALIYLGALICALQTGRRRGLAAVMLTIVVLCHLIVAIYVVVASVVLFIVYSDKVRVFVALQIASVSALLTMFWVLPFVAQRHYMTNMRYEQRPVKGVPTESGMVDSFWQMLFPMPQPADIVLGSLAVAGLVGSIIRRRRLGIALGVLVLGFMGWILKWEDFFPTSHLWNARLLPFMYLCRYFLAALGLFDLTNWFRDRHRAVGYVQSMALSGAVVVTLGLAWQESSPELSKAIYRQYGPVATVDGKTKHDTPFADGWARWNYSGYERKAAYGEYRAVMSTMQAIGADRGCGRALWETDYQGRYGSTMAMMLLPFWSDGCIGSMEGLFFEASGTTPFHFLTVHTLSEKPSGAVRQMNYEPLNLDKGVEYLQTLGVRYYMAFSPKVVQQANATPGLTAIATSGPWHVYEVADAALVEAMDALPVVVENIKGRDRWEAVAQDWFQDSTRRRVLEADDGPADWPRTTASFRRAKGDEDTAKIRRKLEAVTLAPVPTATDVAKATVSNIVTTDDSITFEVDQIGTPVLVRTSYFPNWKATGANGPWRVAPNFMVVVPTSTKVSLNYGRSRFEFAGMGMTALGLVGLVLVRRRTRPFEPDVVESAQHDPLWESWSDSKRARSTALLTRRDDATSEIDAVGVDPVSPGTTGAMDDARDDLDSWAASDHRGGSDGLPSASNGVADEPGVLVDWEDSTDSPMWDDPGSSRLRR
jgi:hypothetical protein